MGKILKKKICLVKFACHVKNPSLGEKNGLGIGKISYFVQKDVKI